jgi:hypothetical protein
MFGITREDFPKALLGAVADLVLFAAIQVGARLFTDPGPLRDISVIVVMALVVFLTFIVVLRLVDRRKGPAGPTTPSQSSQTQGTHLLPPSVDQEPTEDVLRKQWQDAEAQVANLERARSELKEREGLVHRALDTTITWLYRRENWDGLTDDGRHSEPAPKDIWADGKYAQLGLNGVAYQPPATVPSEPGFTPPVADAQGEATGKRGDGFAAQDQGSTTRHEDATPTIPTTTEDHRAEQNRRYESERRALIQAGEGLAQGLRGIQDPPKTEPSTGTAGALAIQGHDWVKRVDDFHRRWHAEATSILSGIGSMRSMTGVDPDEDRYFAEHAAPAPVWRQRLVLGIEYRLDRLRKPEEKPLSRY